MLENNEKNFDLESVLSITTARLFTDTKKVYDILNYLTNSNIFTHQMPRAIKAAQHYILARYPQLEGVGQYVIINNYEDLKTFLNSQKAVFGNSFALSPMPREIYEYMDPIEEAIEMQSGKTR